MSSYHTFSRNWDEFRWEQELRKDEKRINCYFRELPSCLDLPGEEEMLIEDLAARPDLLPAGGPGELHAWSYLNDRFDGFSDEEDEAPVAEGHRKAGENLLNSMDALASEWNIFVGRSLRSDLLYAGMGVACAYAKLLARTADFLDTPPEEKALKRCLGKRAIGDLNWVCSALEEMASLQSSGAGEMSRQQKRLVGLRDQLANLLGSCC